MFVKWKTYKQAFGNTCSWWGSNVSDVVSKCIHNWLTFLQILPNDTEIIFLQCYQKYRKTLCAC